VIIQIKTVFEDIFKTV